VQRRVEWLVAPLGFLAITLVLYRNVFAGGWFGWDCPESFWPDLAFYAGSLRHGEWPLWNPFDRGGYAWAGDPHPGIYYPFTWLFVVPGALFFGGDVPGWMMQAKALLHQALGGLFLYAYLRGRDLSRVAAAFAGVVVVASTPMIIHKASALTWPMVWAPLIWLATDRLVAEPTWRRGVLLGAAVGLAGLAGPPPGFFYILVVSLGYGGLRVAQAFRGRTAAVIVLAAGVAVALLLVTVLPQIDAVSLSGRAERTVAYATNGGLPRDPTLIGLFAPWAGKVDSYLGVLAMIALGVALLCRPLADRGAVVAFTLLGVGATLLSFGSHEPFLGFLVEHVPGFGLFRDANRYKCLATLCFAVPAGHGVHALVTDRRRAAPVAIALLLLVVGHALLRGKVPLPFWLVALGAALAVTALRFVPERLVPVAAAALAVISFVDTQTFAAPFVARSERPVDEAAADRRHLADLADVSREWRVFDEFLMEQRPGSRLRIRDLRGYPAGDPYEDVRYREVMAALDAHPELLEIYNVRYVFHGPHHRIGLGANHLRHPPPFTPLGPRRWETRAPAPLVAWYAGVVEVAKPDDVVPALVALREPDGTRRRAVVETSDLPAGVALPHGDALPVPGQLVDYGLDEITFTVDAPAPGLVVLNEKLHRGWQVTVDGAAAIPVRANSFLRGVVVPAGAHRITWRYTPPHYWPLLALWAIAAIAAVVACRRPRVSAT
jgi:hypothetical protein